MKRLVKAIKKSDEAVTASSKTNTNKKTKSNSSDSDTDSSDEAAPRKKVHSHIIINSGLHHAGDRTVYFAQKVAKQDIKQKEVYRNEMVSDIFNGCFMFVNGFDDEPAVELRRLICSHGGRSHDAGLATLNMMDVTHFVCNLLTDARLKDIYRKKRIGRSYSFVTNAFVLESIKACRRL